MARILDCKEPTLVDIGLAKSPDTVHYFASALSLGFDAAVNAKANEMKFPKGKLKYKIAIAPTLVSYKGRNFIVDIDGKKLEYKGLMTTVMNISNVGGGLELVPNASVKDGLFDVFIIRDISKTKLLRFLPKLATGRHLNMWLIGKYVGKGPFMLTVLPRALQVLL
ncbi:MAG: hypothetical protein QM571_02060 [Micrococcaceae bacterium]